MPTLDNRLSQNAPGAFYVDDSCINCDHCRSHAPQFFGRLDAEGFSYVHRQPVTAEEIALAQEAMLECPTESIGDDGAGAGELNTPSVVSYECGT